MDQITIKRDVFIGSISELLETAGLDKELSINTAHELFEDLSESDVSHSSPLILAKALYHYRRFTLKMNWVKMPEPGSNEWSAIEKLSDSLQNMALNFEISYRSFCTQYAEVIFKINPKLRGRFVYGFLSDLNEQVFRYFEIHYRIKKDPNSSLTQKLVDLYCSRVMENTGVLYQPSNEDLWCFMDIAEYCRNTKTDPHIFIEGAFKLLEFKSGIPRPRVMLNESFILSVAEAKKKGFEAPKAKKINLKTLKDKKW